MFKEQMRENKESGGVGKKGVTTVETWSRKKIDR